MLTWTVFTLWLVNRFGSDAAEAQSTVMRFIQISYLPAVGLGAAVNAVVSRYLGSKDIASARRSSQIALVLAVSYMSACGLIFWLFGKSLGGVFLVKSGQIEIAEKLLVFAAVFQAFDAVNIISISALRAAGDTLFPAVLWMVLSWGLCVGGGYAVVKLDPTAGPAGPWLVATIYVAVLGTANLVRWYSGAWHRLDPLGEKLVNAGV